MRTRFFQWLFCLLAALPCWPAAAQATLTSEQARRDSDILVQTLRALHPALDTYRTQAEVDASFAQFKARAASARTPAAMYLAATALAASIRCGHTWTNVLNQQGAIQRKLLDGADKLPLTITLLDGRWLVLASSAPGIQAGDELLTIDGATSAQVVATMLPYLRAEGSSDGKRLRQLGHDRPDYSMMDILWPLLSPPRDGVYRFTVRSGLGAVRTIEAAATTLAARAASLKAQGIQAPSQAWQLRIDGDLAVMTLPTFSLYRDKFDWQRFLADSFMRLRQQQVKRLVIDIRDNEGGDGAIGLALLSYLVRQPLTYVSDQSVTMVERVPYRLAKHLDTWDDSFFDRTGMVDPITTGPQAGRLQFRPNAAKTTVIAPQEMRFSGKVWLLVGPENSSATFSLAQLARQSGAATLVGQPTGGNQRGLNGGQLAWVRLPNSGVAVDIPLLASSYQADTPDAGIEPDVTVARSFAMQAAGVDQEMAAVMKLSAARP